MSLQVTSLQRKFKYKGKELPDIPGLSLKEVAKTYSGQYPELLNSTPEYKGIEGEFEIYDFSAKAGVKG